MRLAVRGGELGGERRGKLERLVPAGERHGATV
jgi:hypothetical protein